MASEIHKPDTVICKYPSEYAEGGLYFVAKRYSPRTPDPKGLTLLFFLGTGSHKEVWEPIIGDLFGKGLETRLLATELLNGAKRFFAKGVFDGHTLIGVGHTSGSSSLMPLTIDRNGLAGVSYKTLIVMEPPMFTLAAVAKTRPDMTKRMKMVQAAIAGRKNTWNSLAEARE
ncbi:hypothetical protein BD413DRAFT_616673 [Trametes elegans]|nr:hypothetical protein BD413DRAFT_616673 [Trametes elegans]